MERRDSSLRKSAEEGNVAAKYLHALQCSEPEERRRWLKEAAEAGYIPAMCDYAACPCDEADERKHWLREAAYEGHVPAISLRPGGIQRPRSAATLAETSC